MTSDLNRRELFMYNQKEKNIWQMLTSDNGLIQKPLCSMFGEIHEFVEIDRYESWLDEFLGLYFGFINIYIYGFF